MVTLTPEIYASKNSPPKITLTPEIYASKNSPPKITLTPEIYASIDTSRKFILNFDTEITIGFSLNFDTQYNITAEVVKDFDTEITLERGQRITLDFDTAIGIGGNFTSDFDVALNINSEEISNSDTSIIYHQGSIDIKEDFDTEVKLQVTETNDFDTEIKISQGIVSNLDTEIKTYTDMVFNFDTEVEVENDNYNVCTINGDTNVEYYRKITYSYGQVDCKQIDLGDIHTIEVAISIEGEGFAKIRYGKSIYGGNYEDYKPRQVNCRYITVILYVRDKITSAKLSVIPVPKEVTVMEHIPANGKTVSFESFFKPPMIFPSASQYTVKVKNISKNSCYVTLYDENNNPVEGDVALLIKGS